MGSKRGQQAEARRRASARLESVQGTLDPRAVQRRVRALPRRQHGQQACARRLRKRLLTGPLDRGRKARHGRGDHRRWPRPPEISRQLGLRLQRHGAAGLALATKRAACDAADELPDRAAHGRGPEVHRTMSLEHLDRAVDVVEAERGADYLGRFLDAERRGAQERACGLARGGRPFDELSSARVADALDRAVDQRAPIACCAGNSAQQGVRLDAEGAVVGPGYRGGDCLLVGARDRSNDERRLIEQAPEAGEELGVGRVRQERRVPIRVSQQAEVALDLAIDLGDDAFRFARGDRLDEPHAITASAIAAKLPGTRRHLPRFLALDMSDLSFERDILPLFREEDIDSMSFAFDLSSYEDVSQNAEEIHSRLAEGTMPCDGPWPEENVERFRQWIDAGMP